MLLNAFGNGQLSILVHFLMSLYGLTGACPTGYSAFDSKTCFRIYCDELLNLQASKEKCQADNGEQNEFIREMKADCNLPWVLIGLTSQGNADDSCWYWEGRTSFYDFSKWDWELGQPVNNGQDEDCVGMGMHGQPQGGKWHDCGCYSLCAGAGALPPVCRVDLDTESDTNGCPNSCHAALEQGVCDVDTSKCTCLAGWKGADCGCPSSQTCITVIKDGAETNCVIRNSGRNSSEFSRSLWCCVLFFFMLFV